MCNTNNLSSDSFSKYEEMNQQVDAWNTMILNNNATYQVASWHVVNHSISLSRVKTLTC